MRLLLGTPMPNLSPYIFVPKAKIFWPKHPPYVGTRTILTDFPYMFSFANTSNTKSVNRLRMLTSVKFYRNQQE